VKKAKDQPESEPASLVGERIGKIRKEGGGYQLNIPFNFDLTPYIEGDDAAAC